MPPIMKFNNRVDPHSQATVTIDLDHAEVHEGDAYKALIRFATVASGASTAMRMVAPDTDTRIHMKFACQAPLSGIVYVREGCTFSATGTSYIPLCLDRNSTSTGSLVISFSPTVSATGTMIGAAVIGGGSGPQSRVGGLARTNFEYIFKKNTAYALDFIPDTNMTNVLLTAEYYEV